MLTFHPLSLMFLADFADAQLHTQLAETITRQRLHQDINQLLLSANVLNVHLPVANALSNEMIAHIYMFTSIVENGILTECNRRLAVHLQNEGRALLALQLGQQLRQPNALTGRRSPRDILSFTGRQGDDLLLL